MSPSRTDKLFHTVLLGLSLIAVLVLAAIVFFLFRHGLPAFNYLNVEQLWADFSWHPTTGQVNIVPMLVGSVAITLGSSGIATPMGISIAVYGRYYASPKSGFVLRRIMELLAGIPSVVFGFWGLINLVPIVGHSLLAGCLVLAIMILPTIALIADLAIEHVPLSIQKGGVALGLKKWGTISKIVLPTAKNGLIAAALLGSARAIGETMAVLMVTGNIVQLPENLKAPIRTLTANIALEMGYASEGHRALLFLSGLCLMALVTALVWLAHLNKFDARNYS